MRLYQGEIPPCPSGRLYVDGRDNAEGIASQWCNKSLVKLIINSLAVRTNNNIFSYIYLFNDITFMLMKYYHRNTSTLHLAKVIFLLWPICKIVRHILYRNLEKDSTTSGFFHANIINF